MSRSRRHQSLAALILGTLMLRPALAQDEPAKVPLGVAELEPHAVAVVTLP
jgi:hypothetical protein